MMCTASMFRMQESSIFLLCNSIILVNLKKEGEIINKVNIRTGVLEFGTKVLSRIRSPQNLLNKNSSSK